MARKRFGVAVLMAVTILAASAVAQRSNEIGGTIGRSIITDQNVSGTTLTNSNIHFGHGLAYGANFSHRFFNFGIAAISVEVPFIFTPTTKVQFGLNSVPKDFQSYFITPAARLNLFPTTAFSPWVSLGGGVGRFNPNTALEFGGANPSSSTTTGVFEFGGGLDVGVIDHFKVRGEIRGFNSSEPPINLNKTNRYTHLYAGLGVVFNF